MQTTMADAPYAERILVGGGEEGKRTLAEARSRTMWQAICDSAAGHPDKDCLVGARDNGEIGRLTYSGLVERVRNFSTGLARTGVRRGDRVVLWMTNSLDWVVASFSIMRLGATVVPVNTFLKPPEIRYVIEQSGARHLIMLDGFRKLDMPAMLGEICPAFAAADQPGNLCEPSLPDLRHVIMLSRTGRRHPGTHDFATVEEIGRSDGGQWQDIAETMAGAVLPTDLGMVKYTSGSTGFPKGVMLEQGGIVASGVIHGCRVDATDKDIFFSMMPFFHGGGSIWGQMTMLINGGTLVFTEAFDPKLAVMLLDREQPTMMMGVLATEVIDEALAQGKTFPSLRTAHVPSEEGRKVMPNVDYNIMPFGLTETYGPAAVASRRDPPDKLGCSGQLLDGNQLRVVDPVTLKDVAPGEPGEAWLKGNVMRGYWNKPVETANVFTEDGWLRSEDLISVDEDGFISYVGRIKLMLKVGGENVSIEEVESVVESHEAIAQCGAVGVPDERRQEVVRVYVVARPGHAVPEDELRLWLEARLARFKQPRDIVFVDELPRLANGKLDRVTLQRWADEEAAA
ncbi:MAG: acyl--CoA ligase [Novosphingobium sp.]|nr:acyl--CoA ligase [Novosphingobium sp.]